MIRFVKLHLMDHHDGPKEVFVNPYKVSGVREMADLGTAVVIDDFTWYVKESVHETVALLQKPPVMTKAERKAARAGTAAT